MSLIAHHLINRNRKKRDPVTPDQQTQLSEDQIRGIFGHPTMPIQFLDHRTLCQQCEEVSFFTWADIVSRLCSTHHPMGPLTGENVNPEERFFLRPTKWERFLFWIKNLFRRKKP